jgi:hypothetical protein
MGLPIVIVANGMPVTVATNGYGTPVEVASNGYGQPVTYVASGGLPVVTAGAGINGEPIAVAFSPPDNTTGVNTSTNLIALFDQAITLGAAGNITLKKTSDNSTIEAWDVATEAGTGAGQVNVFQFTQLTMRLTAPLAAATEHYVIWDAGVVQDVGAHPCAAQASTTAWSFTTA